MKYFKHLFDSTAAALVSIFDENRHADKVVDYYFKNYKKWGKRDRQFFADSVYGCVRWWNQYEFLAESSSDQPLVKAHKAIAVHLLASGLPLPEWYAELVDENQINLRKVELKSGALLEAFPDWLYSLAAEELGTDVWSAVATQLNKPTRVVMRANSLKTTRDELLKKLHSEGLQVESMGASLPEGLLLLQRANVFNTEAFKSGLFEVQDGSSQLVAPFLDPKPGERVVDACAGAGGKSLHLAALMQNKGKLIALDITAWKIEELKKRARRAGTSIIEPRVVDSTKVIKRLHGTADALLLDVPCSGLGVVKRHPDTKWKLTPQSLNEVKTLQKEILQGYSLIVKPGGRIVYSTCSVLPSENQLQVDEFIKNNPTWYKADEKIILPSEKGFDGFYMALIKQRN